MKILWVIDSPMAFAGGCWFHRNHMPAKGLEGRGHQSRFITINPDIPPEWLGWPDVVVLSRVYPIDPLPMMRRYKAAGKRVVYELDDDLWTVNPDNPAVSVSTEKKWQYEHIISEADAVTTTTEELAKKIRKFNKNVFVCPNCIDFDHYLERPRVTAKLQIGYTGAASHWKDIELVIDPIMELQGKYDFDFVLQGMVSAPLESEAYAMQQILNMKLQPEKTRYLESALRLWDKLRKIRFAHIPFHYPFLHASVLKRCDIDIGLAPLIENEFNHGKSCLKFYEYASTGSVTLASDVLPYNKEVGYCAKNTHDDWENKIEKLIVDKKFRDELYAKQRKWVEENRSLKIVAALWEKALDVKPICENTPNYK